MCYYILPEAELTDSERLEVLKITKNLKTTEILLTIVMIMMMMMILTFMQV